MKIVLLMGPSRSGVFLYNYLKQHFTIDTVFLEDGVSKNLLIRGRIRKLGWFKVIGQLFFQTTLSPLIKKFSGKRERELIKAFQLSEHQIDPEKIIKVPSVNEKEVLEKLKTLKPDLVIINGTRILSKELLNTVSCSFVNIHAGITPRYRGVHGGYWALVNNDAEHCGSTIHLVDAGIDTGSVLKQIFITPGKTDTFFTYPILQLATALPELVKILKSGDPADIKSGAYKSVGPSKLWYHPTFFQYVYFRIFKGVK